MNHLPPFLNIGFILTVLFTLFLFLLAIRKTNLLVWIIPGICIWIGLQTWLGITHYFHTTNTVPPRFMLLIAPPLIGLMGLFLSRKGRKLIDECSLKTLTFIHVIRVPVEVILFQLFLQKMIPINMTFEGSNWDFLTGISAIFLFYFTWKKRVIGRKGLLIWNTMGLCLLINIVVHAVLSAPFPFQQWGFEQPNVAILTFPFNFLPSVIVPLVLFSHLASFRLLLRKINNEEIWSEVY